MPKKSAPISVVRKSADQIPAASEKDLDRLRTAMAKEIDLSKVPERRGPFSRLKRNANGKLPKKSLIREAVTRELESRNMTVYQLWKQANALCPTLSQPAVYEFIKGQRMIGLEYAEALMSAVCLGIVRKAPRRRKTDTRAVRLVTKKG
jgi:hypothetical protein